MKTRIIAALALIPVLLAVLLWAPPVLVAIIVGIVCVIGAYELLFGTGLVRHIRLFFYTAVMAFCMPIWCYFGMPAIYARVGVFLFTAILFAEILLSKGKLRLEKVAVCYIGGLLIPYLLSSLVRLIGDGSSRSMIFLPFILAFMADTGAYFIGCRFGKHKLAPTISPKKSVEGLIGGVVFAVLGTAVFCLVMQLAFSHTVNYLFALIYGIIGALAGTFGDLCFSVIKRQAGIKDYGNLIPGHGGVLDRFDSVIIVAPLTELLLIFLPILE